MDSPLDLDAFGGDIDKLAAQIDAVLTNRPRFNRVKEIWANMADADRHEMALSIATWLLR